MLHPKEETWLYANAKKEKLKQKQEKRPIVVENLQKEKLLKKQLHAAAAEDASLQQLHLCALKKWLSSNLSIKGLGFQAPFSFPAHLLRDC
ncbi:MAG: hypothetical protein K1X28_04740 [Parachlamydiales bacterium]|nr:hypothetical protein [Parachlamydiales bacterium]